MFSCYYCSIDLKRQSEHLEIRPDMSNLVSISIQFKTPLKFLTTMALLTFCLPPRNWRGSLLINCLEIG